MICNNMQRYAIICNDIQWYTMIYNDIQWYTMRCNDAIRWIQNPGECLACRTLCCLDILLYSWGQHCHLYHHHHHHPHHQWWSTIAILTISVNLLLRLRTFGQYTGSANKEKEGENPKQTISFHQNTFFEQCSNQTFIHLKVRSNTQFKHIWIQNISLFVPTTHRFSCWNWFLGLFFRSL